MSRYTINYKSKTGELKSVVVRPGIDPPADLSDAAGHFPPGRSVEILLQAIVEPVGKTTHGAQVRLLAPAWNELVRVLQMDPEALHRLTARQFEELIAATYDKAGYDEVVLTPRSGDLGRDVIATKRGWGSVRILDQAKCFSPGHLVTANDVRALLGVLHSDPNATKGIITTSSDFAPRIREEPAIQSQVPFRLELINGTELLARLKDLNTR